MTRRVLIWAKIAPTKFGSFEAAILRLLESGPEGLEYHLVWLAGASARVQLEFNAYAKRIHYISDAKIDSWHCLADICAQVGADVVHLHYMEICHPITRWLGRNKRIRSVFTWHGGPPVARKRSLLSILRRYRRVWYAKQFDQLTSVSVSAAHNVANTLGWHPEKVLVIYNGVDLQRFKPSVTPHRVLSVLYVGELNENKGVEDFLAVLNILANKYPAVIWQLAGVGELENAVRLAATKQKSLVVRGIEDSIEEVLVRSDVMVVPTRTHEAFSFIAAEAAACGLPVVATRVGGLNEVVVNGETGILVEPSQPEAIAAAVTQLLDNPALRETMGLHARLRCLENFELNRMVAEYNALYNKLDLP